MSSAETSPTRGLTAWWRQLKKHTSDPSIDAVVDGPMQRPLHFKSKSFTTVRKDQSPPSKQKIRQQRDEFLASQNTFGFGNEVFGVGLEQSIGVAESLISVPSEDPGDFIRYGRIPLVVGKCGSHLKQTGLKVEGIFRVAGSSRRVKELQYVFSASPEYGRKLSWDAYTVHDAASLFRRFLNHLPEPLVPLDLYDEFREPVRSRPRIIQHIKARSDSMDKRVQGIQNTQKQEGDHLEEKEDPSAGLTEEEADAKKQKELKKQKKIAKDLRSALKEYRILFDKLPEANRHLLYYLLDLLTMFADNARDNLMPARNLAAVFQPSILSHPDHDLSPDEYALSQAVVEVLIEYSKRLLPDVKKFKPDATAASTQTSPQQSTKNSSTNLLSVAQGGSRPHSRSMSAAGGAPDVLTTQHYAKNNNTETNLSTTKQTDEETSDDDQDEEFHSTKESTTPSHQPSLSQSPTKSIITGVASITVDDTPSKMPPPRINLNTPPPAAEEGEERQSRWSNNKSDALLSPGKKESWFKRLRSSSRGNKD